MTDGSRPVVLISDDEPNIVHALARHAKRLGLEVVMDTQSDVLSLAKKHRPRVVVLDIHQSGVDGRDLLATLKRDPELEDIEVVVMSGVREPHTSAECIALGAAAFVQKPVAGDFMDCIARLANSEPGEELSWLESAFRDD